MEADSYQKAFHLKEYELSEESIKEFKRILDEEGDPLSICHRMIAALYYYRLNDPEQAIPFAVEAVSLSPQDEMASLCLVHCLYDIGHPLEMEKEIRRFVATGGKLELYKPFLEENGSKLSDFV